MRNVGNSSQLSSTCMYCSIPIVIFVSLATTYVRIIHVVKKTLQQPNWITNTAFCIRTYGTRHKECNKCPTVALISTVYHAPRLSLCVRRTLTLFLKVRCLVKCRNPWIVALFSELRHVWQKVLQHYIPRLPHKSRGKP